MDGPSRLEQLREAIQGPAATTPDTDQPQESGGPLRITVRPKRLEDLRLGAEGKYEPPPQEPAPPAPSSADVGWDVLKSLGTGAGRGAVGIAGMPGDIASLTRTGLGKVVETLAKHTGADPEHVKQAVEYGLRAFPTTAPFFQTNAPTSEEIQKKIEEHTGKFYEPKTAAGEAAQTVGEFAPGMLMGPGGVGRSVGQIGANLAKRVIPNVLAPAAASETAGQVARALTGGEKDQPVEKFARAGGALVGAGAGAALSSAVGKVPAAEALLAGRLPHDLTPQVVDQAGALIHHAAAGPTPIRLSWPEALSQVVRRPVLQDEMRVLESNPETRERMAQFFDGRPQAIDATARREFGAIAPPTNAPSAIGPEAGENALATINQTRQAISATARPYYQAAETAQPQSGVGPPAPRVIADGDFRRLIAMPAFRDALGHVRGDPILNGTVAGYPNNSVRVIDLVKKYHDARLEDAANPMRGTAVERLSNAQREEARGFGIQAADEATGSQPGPPRVMGDYETARATVQMGRERYLDPLLRGPLGKIADKDITTQKAIGVLFPKNPLPGSEDEIGAAVGALARRNPINAAQLVRAHLETVFNDAATALQGGMNQYAGAKFFVRAFGNPQAAANAREAVQALPGGTATWSGFRRFLDVVEATGMRQAPGSKTAFNTAERAAMEKSSPIAEIGKAAASPTHLLAVIGEKWNEWQIGRNSEEIAHILTDPHSAALLKRLSSMRSDSTEAQMLAARVILQMHEATRKQ